MFHFNTITSQLNLLRSSFFCTFAGIKKQKISAYYVFRKYRLKIIYSGTNFSSFLDVRLILSITAQSVFAVKLSAWARWKGILIENPCEKLPVGIRIRTGRLRNFVWKFYMSVPTFPLLTKKEKVDEVWQLLL
jgi:hypothetical protein